MKRKLSFIYFTAFSILCLSLSLRLAGTVVFTDQTFMVDRFEMSYVSDSNMLDHNISMLEGVVNYYVPCPVFESTDKNDAKNNVNKLLISGVCGRQGIVYGFSSESYIPQTYSPLFNRLSGLSRLNI